MLRKTSLDELPQIWNTFVVHISLIGPRPALWNQYDLITERDQYGANDILPGLTGWAQINGRDELTIEDKVRLDGDYVRQSSLDGCKVLLWNNASALANLIVQFCQNSEKEQMATNSYDYYCKNYSKERFLAVLEETLIKMEV